MSSSYVGDAFTDALGNSMRRFFVLFSTPIGQRLVISPGLRPMIFLPAALPGVLCRLYSGDMLVQKSVSEHPGAFTIATEKKDEVILRFSLAGFSETEILIAPGAKNLDLGQILLTESIDLDELTVTSISQYNVRGRTIVYPA